MNAEAHGGHRPQRDHQREDLSACSIIAARIALNFRFAKADLVWSFQLRSRESFARRFWWAGVTRTSDRRPHRSSISGLLATMS
jgi:hypothetical protein